VPRRRCVGGPAGGRQQWAAAGDGGLLPLLGGFCAWRQIHSPLKLSARGEKAGSPVDVRVFCEARENCPTLSILHKCPPNHPVLPAFDSLIK
jgi:hypothetical protein